MKHDREEAAPGLAASPETGPAARLLSLRATEDAAVAGRPQPLDAARPAPAARLRTLLSAVAERLLIIARAATPAGDRERNHIRLWLKLRMKLPVEANRYVSATKRRGPDYAAWLAHYDTLTAADQAAIELHLAAGGLPLLAVIAVLDNPDRDAVERLVQQLRSQMLQNWRAIICVRNTDVSSRLVQPPGPLVSDSRITLIAGRPEEIAWATQLHGYSHVLLVGDGVTLRDRTLYAFAATACANPAARLIYADHDRMLADGMRDNPHFKPEFSPERHRRSVFLGSCALLCDDGSGFDALIAHLHRGETIATIIDSRAAALPRAAVHHIPLLLFHQDLPRFMPRMHDEPALPDSGLPSIAIIIPTKDRLDLLRLCIESIERLSDYPSGRYRIVVVDNNSEEPATLEYLHSAENLVVLRDDGPFNYSRINNSAVAAVPAELIVFLNNDTEIIRPDWLRRLAAFAMQPDVGAVGPKLLFPDSSVQHAGIVVGFRGVAAHGLIGVARDDGGYGNLANLTREVSAVTGACLAMRSSVFHEVGGFDEALAVTFNDVALCLAAQVRGYRNIYLAEPLIVHHESQSRGYDETPEKISRNTRAAFYARSRFLDIFKDDPYYSPNLSLDDLYEIAEPPRSERPWLRFAAGVARASGLPGRVLLLGRIDDPRAGLAAVLALHAAALVRAGFTVFVGGPLTESEPACTGCHRVGLTDAAQAVEFAYRFAIDCVVIYTQPFLAMLRTLGPGPRSVIYDHAGSGSPGPQRAVASAADAYERRHCSVLADRLYTDIAAEQVAARQDRTDVITLAQPTGRGVEQFVAGVHELCDPAVPVRQT